METGIFLKTKTIHIFLKLKGMVQRDQMSHE